MNKKDTLGDMSLEQKRRVIFTSLKQFLKYKTLRDLFIKKLLACKRTFIQQYSSAREKWKKLNSILGRGTGLKDNNAYDVETINHQFSSVFETLDPDFHLDQWIESLPIAN